MLRTLILIPLTVLLTLSLTPVLWAQCMEGDCINGIGTKITRGHTYRGSFKNNHRNGLGYYEFLNGDRYEGNFVEGEMEGQGIYYYANGERFEGEFHKNKREGTGAYFTANDRVLRGIWQGNILVSPGAEVASEDLDDSIDVDKILRDINAKSPTDETVETALPEAPNEPIATTDEEEMSEQELDALVDQLLDQ
ncbi:MAG: hypothetical protein KKB70_05120 [Proteobacteria bacterium]|nr:hypothetical protein [Pseudomonadota bacterium]MBU1610880.1 hypothetical protein [Pseudomonadota bacterium]